jgi:hypothetical protein
VADNLKDNHWTRDAKCKFDKKFLSFHIDDVREAKEICRTCTVQRECMMFAEEVDATFIAAGTSRYDRLVKRWKRVE